MKVFNRQKFESFYDRDSEVTFSDIEFRRCYFESCRLSITREPRLRSTIRNINLLNCEQHGCAVNAAIIEDVLVDGLKTHGLLQTWAAVFKHVILRGFINRVMFSSAVAAGLATKTEQLAFDEANAECYATVDWALDISEGEFEECEIQGIPARLIRRDPATQVVVKRQKAIQGHWRELDLSKTHWGTSIAFLLERGEGDTVLVAGKRDKKFRQLVDGLKLLRDSGVAEPD